CPPAIGPVLTGCALSGVPVLRSNAWSKLTTVPLIARRLLTSTLGAPATIITLNTHSRTYLFNRPPGRHHGDIPGSPEFPLAGLELMTAAVSVRGLGKDDGEVKAVKAT
ncbi:MAG TPA: hypothetical protein VN786_07955, partial [Acidimicrobiales bacterium]|nr:hypothetical protein [Acidimicrobiales bacterium]